MNSLHGYGGDDGSAASCGGGSGSGDGGGLKTSFSLSRWSQFMGKANEKEWTTSFTRMTAGKKKFLDVLLHFFFSKATGRRPSLILSD